MQIWVTILALGNSRRIGRCSRTKNILRLCPWFLTQSFYSPRNFLSEKSFLVMPRRYLRLHSWIVSGCPLVTKKGKHVIGGFGLSITRLCGKRGARDWAQSFNQLCVHIETAIKTLGTKFSRTSLLMNAFTCLENTAEPGRWHAPTPQRASTGVLCSKPSQTTPYVIICWGKKVILSIALLVSTVSASSELSKQWGLLEHLNLYLFNQTIILGGLFESKLYFTITI